MNSAIRSATKQDADFLSWAILSAARSHLAKGWFDIVLEGSESSRHDFIRRLTLTPARSWWHYSRFFIAEVEGIPAATLCAFRAGDAYPLSQQAMTEVARELGWSDLQQQAIWKRGAYIFACTLETGEDAWAIENVATLPLYRGRGLASQLLKRAVEEAQRSGARQMPSRSSLGMTRLRERIQKRDSTSQVRSAVRTLKQRPVHRACDVLAARFDGSTQRRVALDLDHNFNE